MDSSCLKTSSSSRFEAAMSMSLERISERRLESVMSDQFAYCETQNAASNGIWHIRRISSKGRCLGGGADTAAMCGRDVSWDLKVPVNLESHQEWVCESCWKESQEATNE